MPAIRRTSTGIQRPHSGGQSASRSLSRTVTRTELTIQSPDPSDLNSSLEIDDLDSSISPSISTNTIPSDSRLIIPASEWLENPTLPPDSDELSPESLTPAQITLVVKSELKALNSTRHSWAWGHFDLVVVQKEKKVSRAYLTILDLQYKCKLTRKNRPEPCESLITPSGGTRSLLRHLTQVHKMTDPNPNPKRVSCSRSGNHVSLDLFSFLVDIYSCGLLFDSRAMKSHRKW